MILTICRWWKQFAFPPAPVPLSKGSAIAIASGLLGRLLIDQLFTARTPPAQIAATGIHRQAAAPHETVQSATSIKEL
jgi:hypothetical protein